MKAKRAKQYRKLMQQYGITFGLREPYQVLLDAEIIQDASRFSMDMQKSLERTVGGKVKPMITQCSIRHLYNATPKNDAHIALAKTFERRRCGHHELEEPLSTIDCLSSVVDPKEAGVNKYNYIVASQDSEVRAKMRSIPGVPLIYIKRSIMILEPMAGASTDARTREERAKYKAGVARATGRGSVLGKRGRQDDLVATATTGDSSDRKKRKVRGAKGPNPLSVKKPKVREPKEPKEVATPTSKAPASPARIASNATEGVDGEAKAKRKRKRKHKPDVDGVGLQEVPVG